MSMLRRLAARSHHPSALAGCCGNDTNPWGQQPLSDVRVIAHDAEPLTSLGATSPEEPAAGEPSGAVTFIRGAYVIAAPISVGLSAYHGYKRNDSLGWAIGWGLLGGIFPVLVPAIALAQGFGEPAKK